MTLWADGFVGLMGVNGKMRVCGTQHRSTFDVRRSTF
jgi:hypothetical protein